MSIQALIESSAVSSSATLLEAISAIDRSQVQLALVMEKPGILLGIMTDGDVRRALLSGRNLEDPIEPHYTRNFLSVDPGTGRTEVLELMQSRILRHIPIVDGAGKIRGIHFLSHMLAENTLPNAACILAGGRGQRLSPFTDTTPKPMLKVAGRPILERIVLHLIGHGVRKFYFAVNYLSQVIKEHFGDGSNLGCDIEYLDEVEPLGTAGPLAELADRVEESLLVMNGDLVSQFDVRALLTEHQSLSNAITICTRLYHHKVPFGCVELEGQEVRSLREKPTLHQVINAGIYVLEPNTLKQIPQKREYPMTQLIEEALSSGQRVGSFALVDDWMDVGHPKDLYRARGLEP